MGNVVRISSDVLAAIRAEVAATTDQEVCGLLFGDDQTVTAHRACRNVAVDPATAFEIDPAALIAAYRAERAGGARINGCYHSHPSGDPHPSQRDAADAVTPGWLWLIGVGPGVRAWRVVPGGPVHGRFEPVDLATIDGA